MNFSNFITSVLPSVTLEFNQKVLEMLSKGEDVVKLTAGEPDFPTPKPIIEAAIEAMQKGKTKYTNASGIPLLREKISEKLRAENHLDYSPNEIIVTNGGKQALYNTLSAILNPGDEVILLSPAWVSYDAQVKMCGGIPVFVETKMEDGFLPIVEAIERVISPRTRAMIINSPNNPTGAMYPKALLAELANLAKSRDIFVISDEVYEKLSFDEKHYSIASIKGMKDRTAVINAFSKAYAMTGWRIGYVAAPPSLAKQISKIQSHLSSNVNTMTQYAAVRAFEVDISKMVEEFKKRREYVETRLKGIGVPFSHPKGAFYFFIDIRDYLNETYPDSLSFAIALLEKAKVGMIPGSAFNAEGFIRLSYASSIEELEKGLDRFEGFLRKT